MSAREGKIEFRVKRKTKWSTGSIPKENLYKSDGTLQGTETPIQNEKPRSGTGTYRRRIKKYGINCTHVEYKYGDEEYGVTSVETPDGKELRYRTFPVDNGFAEDAILKFSKMKKVDDELDPESDLFELVDLEGHDGGSIRHDKKINLRYRYKDETYELRYSDPEGSNEELICSDFPTDPSFVKESIEDADEEDRFRAEKAGIITGNAYLLLMDGILFGAGLIGSAILAVITALVLGIVGWVIGLLLPWGYPIPYS